MLRNYIKEYLNERLKIQINDKNGLEDDISNFISFCLDKLSIPKMPSISVVNQIQGGTHGVYYPGKSIIKSVGRGRCLSDILRSIAHELVHHKQNIEDRLHNDEYKDTEEKFKLNNLYPNDYLYIIEDEANALAGQLVKAFGQKNPHIYKTY